MEIYFSLESLLFPPFFFGGFLGSCIFFLFGSEEMDSGFLYRFLMFLRGIRNYHIGLVGKMVQLISSHRYLMLFSVRLSFLCVFFFGYVGKSCVCDSVF